MPITMLEAPLVEPMAMFKPSSIEGTVAPFEATPPLPTPKRRLGTKPVAFCFSLELCSFSFFSILVKELFINGMK